MIGTYETCCVCDSDTGRAGVADDSLYIYDDGPFCYDCYAQLIQTQLNEANAAYKEGI